MTAEPGDASGGVALADVQRARERIRRVAVRTPTLQTFALRDRLEADLWCKAENLQRTGSFKVRGAYNRLGRLAAGGRSAPVIAASAGNHAQGVALAARDLGLPCTIVMPTGASLAKIEATKRLGAAVRLHGASYDDASAEARRLAAEHGWELVPAFDDPDVVAGQGTIGLEILEDVPAAATIVVPIGGGGLAAGVGVAVKALRPACRLIGVQASANAGFAAARAAGRPVDVGGGRSIADGIAIKRVGGLPFRLLMELLDDCVLVHEDEIVSTMALLLERTKLVVEGAGAVGVAALLAGRIELAPGPVVAVLSGGNVDINLVARVIHYGLTRAGRYLHLATRLPDRPGELHELLGVIADLGANVLDVNHHREGMLLPVNEVQVELTVETRDPEHCREIIAHLLERGYLVSRDGPVGAGTGTEASPA